MTNSPDGINWIKISDATASGKYIYRTAEKIKPEGVKRSRFVNEGDFLLSNSMSFGRPYIMKTTGCIHDGWLVLSNKTDTFDKDFLYYFLGSPTAYAQFDRLAAGSTVRNLNIDSVSKVTAPVPPLPEQQRIVAILDEAFEGLAVAAANAEKNLKNARELFDGHLRLVFASASECWASVSISTIADHCLGKMLDKKKNKGIPRPYLRNLNVRWFDFALDDVSEMPFEADEGERYTARQGDLLICEGGYPGRAAIWRDKHPIYFQKAIHRVRFIEPSHAEWFLNFLYISDQTGTLRSHFTGAGIQHLTGQALARICLPVPPPDVIAKHNEVFSEFREAVGNLETVYNDRLKLIGELKQSLLHKAFTGELTSRAVEATLEAAQ